MRVQNKILLQKLDKTNAAAAQCVENESDPGQTWTCGRLFRELGTHSGVSVENTSGGIEGRTASGFFLLCRVRGESSLSVEGLHVDLQLSRSTCHCLHAFLH